MKTTIKWLLVLLLGIVLYYVLSMNNIQEQHDFNITPIYAHEDMNCGNNESLSNYNSFMNVPAGIEDTVIINGVKYKMNENKTHWMPIYPDEYVMWITGDGDTIWE